MSIQTSVAVRRKEPMHSEYITQVVTARAKLGLRTDPRELDRLTDEFAREQAWVARENAVLPRELNVADDEVVRRR